MQCHIVLWRAASDVSKEIHIRSEHETEAVISQQVVKTRESYRSVSRNELC